MTTENKQPDERAAFVKAVQSLAFLCRTETKRLDDETLAALDNVENQLVAMGVSARDGDLRATTQQANKGDEQPSTAELEVAVETLRHVIECLRNTGSYSDEEGEATDFLEPLLQVRAAAPQAVTISDACIDALVRSSCHSDPVTKDGEYCLTVDEVRALLAAHPEQRMSDAERDPESMARRALAATDAYRVAMIHELQKALAYWMPKVFDDRSADDAYLLVGYEGEDETSCWGDQMVAALPRWMPVDESLPTEPGWYLAILKPDNDWGLMSDTALQVEFDAYTSKPKAFTCFYDHHGDEDITEAVTHWMRMPSIDTARKGDSQ